MNLIIGFSGRLRSGKDTAAAGLLADGWHHASFAAALKQFTYNMNPVIPGPRRGELYRLAPLVDAYGWEVCKDTYPEVRALLQRCGTDAGRVVLGDNVWVDAAMTALPTGTPAVFTDVRFPNEADAIRARGGLVIRVERPSLPPLEDDAHPSETAMLGYPFHAIVVNDGTVGDLARKVQAVVDTSRAA